MNTICIYGAASDRINDIYIEQVFVLGKELGAAGYGMIYGGGATGLMGAAARGMKSENAEIIGVTPRFMHSVEKLYDDCTDLIETQTMAERKSVMESNADAFVVVPGGIGTFDEFFQILTLKELGELGNKPIILFNVNGYYNTLYQMMKEANEKGFFRDGVMDLFKMSDDPDEIVSWLNVELKTAP